MDCLLRHGAGEAAKRYLWTCVLGTLQTRDNDGPTHNVTEGGGTRWAGAYLLRGGA